MADNVLPFRRRPRPKPYLVKFDEPSESEITRARKIEKAFAETERAYSGLPCDTNGAA